MGRCDPCRMVFVESCNRDKRDGGVRSVATEEAERAGEDHRADPAEEDPARNVDALRGLEELAGRCVIPGNREVAAVPVQSLGTPDPHRVSEDVGFAAGRPSAHVATRWTA